MKRVLLGIVLMLGALASFANADELAEVKKRIETRFPGMPVQHLSTTPLSGLYEAVIGGRLVYVDAKAEYLLVGSLIDAKTQRNLTRDRAQELFRTDFDALPKDKAIKLVKGNGKRAIAVFSDPDCPYCKKLEESLQGLTDVTIYTYLYPIESLHPQAKSKAVSIWCSSDPAKAWSDWMLNGTKAKAPACENPVDQTIALAKSLGISATPTLILGDGRIATGALSTEQLEQLLGAATPQ